MIEFYPVPGGAGDGDGLFKLVDASDLERAQEEGWRLVALAPVQANTVRPVVRSAPQGTYFARDRRSVSYVDENGCPRSQWVEAGEILETEREVMWTMRCLVRKTRDDVLADLKERLEAAQSVSDDRARALGKAEHERDEAAARVTQASQELAEKTEECGELADEVKRLNEHGQKLERDLGRLREHFGTKAVAEALKR